MKAFLGSVTKFGRAVEWFLASVYVVPSVSNIVAQAALIYIQMYHDCPSKHP
jgi:hypothetical protein